MLGKEPNSGRILAKIGLPTKSRIRQNTGPLRQRTRMRQAINQVKQQQQKQTTRKFRQSANQVQQKVEIGKNTNPVWQRTLLFRQISNEVR